MDIKNIEKNQGQIATVLKAAANDRRLTILCALYEGEKSVSTLEKIVGLSQSALSQHLARLRRDRVVKTRRDAQTIYYSLNSPEIKKLLETLSQIYG